MAKEKENEAETLAQQYKAPSIKPSIDDLNKKVGGLDLKIATEFDKDQIAGILAEASIADGAGDIDSSMDGFKKAAGTYQAMYFHRMGIASDGKVAGMKPSKERSEKAIAAGTKYLNEYFKVQSAKKTVEKAGYRVAA